MASTAENDGNNGPESNLDSLVSGFAGKRPLPIAKGNATEAQQRWAFASVVAFGGVNGVQRRY